MSTTLTVCAQRLEHGVVVGVACGEVEHELGRDPEASHARVVDGAAEQVAPCRLELSKLEVQ